MIAKTIIMNSNSINRALIRISHEILEKNNNINNLVFVGIKTRGIPLARRISTIISDFEGKSVNVGTIDITYYRDDLTQISAQPNLCGNDINFDIVDKDVVIIDDVLFTGRTARASMEAIIALGRPKTIQLAVLIDRGHRELPIRADYVGKNLPTARMEVVKVELQEVDGTDMVTLLNK